MYTEKQETLYHRLIVKRNYAIVDPEKMVTCNSSNDRIQFFLCADQKLDMAYFYKSYDRVEPDVAHLIFIFEHATIQIKKLKMYKDVLRMEFFSVQELQRLLDGNRLIPKHVQVDDATRNAVLAQYGREHLPNLLQSDPVARLYDFAVDSVIQIDRPDVVYYRLVVPDE